MIDGYEHHLFLSYRRKGTVPDWVQNHFAPRLQEHLEDLLPEEPSIFVDAQIETGSCWPERLSQALQRSCFLLSIWTPSYFQSPWCMAEWHTMRERERLLGLRCAENPAGLVYPVVYSDGENFPNEAQIIQHRTDLRDYNIPDKQYDRTEDYIQFRRRVQGVANELADWIKRPPTWDASWPVLRPAPEFSPTLSFRRL